MRFGENLPLWGGGFAWDSDGIRRDSDRNQGIRINGTREDIGIYYTGHHWKSVGVTKYNIIRGFSCVCRRSVTVEVVATRPAP
jgi:hypothetical protein